MSDVNANLEALANMAAETDAANPSHAQASETQAQAQAASASDTAAQEWGMLMFTVGGFAQMIAPELKDVYSEQRCFAWGQQANAVAKKYGWNSPSNMPELALLASTVGFAVPTYLLVRQKIQQAKSGGGAGWLAQVGLWWRTRRARKSAASTVHPEPQQQGAGDGVQQ